MTRLFEIDNGALVEASRKSLEAEKHIEDWVEKDLSLIGVSGVVIGRQVLTAYDHKIDLLALNEDGDLVIVELKRDRTARDVVGQVLDYASWVSKLTTNEIYDIAQKHTKRSLPDLYRDRFGRSIPDTLNASHQMMIVASDVDEASKRIIEYLSEVHGVGINASFFNVFAAQGREWLTADSLLDQEQVKVRAERKVRPPWTGFYYITGGSEEDRPWEDLRRFGFFSANGGRRYTNPLDNLSIGDRVFYYQKNRGYLGFGLVTATKAPAAEYRLADGRLLVDVLPAHYLTEAVNDPELCAYIVGIEWRKTFALNDAKTFRGIFANQNIVCKIYSQETIDFLREQFGVEDDLGDA